MEKDGARQGSGVPTLWKSFVGLREGRDQATESHTEGFGLLGESFIILLVGLHENGSFGG